MMRKRFERRADDNAGLDAYMRIARMSVSSSGVCASLWTIGLAVSWRRNFHSCHSYPSSSKQSHGCSWSDSSEYSSGNNNGAGRSS